MLDLDRMFAPDSQGAQPATSLLIKWFTCIGGITTWRCCFSPFPMMKSCVKWVRVRVRVETHELRLIDYFKIRNKGNSPQQFNGHRPAAHVGELCSANCDVRYLFPVALWDSATLDFFVSTWRRACTICTKCMLREVEDYRGCYSCGVSILHSCETWEE